MNQDSTSDFRGNMDETPTCRACGSSRVLPPSALDPHGPWRCLQCGATWRTTKLSGEPDRTEGVS